MAQMSLPYFIALRLSLRSSSGRAAASVVIAVTGIALSVVVMLISVSVMTGFKEDITQKIMGFDAQLTVVSGSTDAADPHASLVEISEIKPSIDRLPSHVSASLTIRQAGIIKTSEDFTGVSVKGMDLNYDWDFIKENLVEGAIPDYSDPAEIYSVVMSRSLCNILNLNLGDKVDVYFLGQGAYKTRRLKIAGIYNTHFSEYDNAYIFGTIKLLAGLARLPEGCGTLIEVYGLESDEEIARCREELQANLMDDLYTHRTERFYRVSDVHSTAALFFNWLSLLDTNVVVILTIMGLLTALTLISSLYILILQRVNLIGVLKALGAADRLIRRTFIILTIRILAIGLVAGNVVALVIIFLQRTYEFIPLNPDAYYLDHVPMAFSISTFLLLNVAVVVLSFLILILPSAIITTIPPSRVIRYD